jgi:hypothetical protein
MVELSGGAGNSHSISSSGPINQFVEIMEVASENKKPRC